MANIERWKPNKEVDPKYPYYCWLNEAGEIVYSVPLEAPIDIPVDADDPDADRYEYSYLPLLGGKNLRVYCWETTDREWAYKVRGMFNTAHTQERRYSNQHTVVPVVLGDGLDDGNRKVPPAPSGKAGEPDEQIVGGLKSVNPDSSPQNGFDQHGWPDVEKQVLDRMEIEAIRKLVKNMDSRYWELFCQVRVYGEEAKKLADTMNISVQRVYQLADKVREIAEKYRREDP